MDNVHVDLSQMPIPKSPRYDQLAPKVHILGTIKKWASQEDFDAGKEPYEISGFEETQDVILEQ